ncbi:Flagellar protein FliT [Vibrio aerogenes CECT 7868]|uniref:Flagellar protein FliT n=1 Tax=Vibrio aerogenes CECT 7868 TaxID=1216006 RepID=A0A1M5W7I8_9VIBR|nr:flagellar protein FliT [Vibrio aerogenes]SHH83398.1 Flagellar protein FliT [Vibrio aerogenes CECT 7868]
MEDKLALLSDIDRKIEQYLAAEDINAEEVHQLVDKRDQLLQELIYEVSENEQFSGSEQWQDAIKRTQQLVEEMQLKTAGIGKSLQKYRYGNKSVQHYKKFL